MGDWGPSQVWWLERECHESPHGCGELDSGPLKEQTVLLIAAAILRAVGCWLLAVGLRAVGISSSWAALSELSGRGCA